MRAYDHIQRGYVSWLLALIAIALGVAAATTGESVPLPPLFGGCAALFTLLALSFHHLRVHDDGDAVRIAFGPLPLFRKRLPYDEIARAEPGTSNVLDGWGIHYVPGRGWTWNLQGFGCAVVTLRSGATLRIGTDEPERLAQFLDEAVRMRGSGPA